MSSCGSNSQSPGCKETVDVFKTELDASEINMQLFNMPTSNVAKRLAIIGGEEGAQNRAWNDASSGNSPIAMTASDPYNLEPHPLNYTLDHAMTEEEAVERKQNDADQALRLSKHMQKQPLTIRQRDTQPLVIVLMGLPARGKTYISRRIMRYLAWLGVKTQVFNIAIYRRKNLGFPDAEFFNHHNTENKTKLLEVFEQALEDLVSWVTNDKGQVAIFDGTNHSIDRRALIIEKLLQVVPKDRIMFIEMCDIMGGASDSVSQKEILLMPEYIGIDPTKANSDFERRISYYASAYETLSNSEGVPFIKCYRNKMKMHRTNGYLTGKLTFLLMNLKVMHRHVYLCVTEGTSSKEPDEASKPESDFLNDITRTSSDPSPQDALEGSMERGKTPLDSSSARLRKISQKNMSAARSGTEGFAQALLSLLEAQVPNKEEVTIWSANDSADADTVTQLQKAGYPHVSWRYLDQCGFSVAEQGETYEDIIERLEPIIFEIERCPTHLMICGHGTVMTALHSYLGECAPTHLAPCTVVKIQPRAYDLDCEAYVMKNNQLMVEEREKEERSEV
eukprot:TRINITY_DN679_c1_g2_i1.p1 TRINITY_DN679_c1_g2~~TRINITY_DN679_c1_g2_i1.p1  ORF type:complete len:563 (+),score=74.89 TRINITY_DN679_c1_g2_i1:81-1769(+)